MKYFLFVLLAVSFIFIAVAQAGTIQAPLDEMMANTSGKIGVIVALADRVDNASLDQQLQSRHATLAQRHFEVITALRNKATETQSEILSQLSQLEANGKVEKVRNFWIANMISFKGTPEAIRQIAALGSVDKVYFDFPVETMQPIIDPNYHPPVIASHPDGLEVIHAPEVWAMGYTGAGRLVSTIDTGVDGTHPALSARWRGNNGHPHNQCWFDPVQNTLTPTDHGQHGTHTMGTICGRSTTTPDTVGVAINAQWIAAGAVDYGGTTADIIASFQFISDPDGDPNTTDDVPDVVGNSWGYSPQLHGVPHCDPTFWSAIDGCENAGVVVIFSAGNEGSYGANSLRTPADRATTYVNAFSVGAIDGHTPGYPIASFSSLGPCSCATGDMAIKPECVAPGVNVYSSIPGGTYAGDWSGTSMASPHISGSVAILRQVNPNLDVTTLKNILLQSCVDLGPVGEDNTYGHGYLDLRIAVQLAMTGYGFIEGYVRDAGTNNPIPATVSVVGGSQSSTANSQGHYVMALPADSMYTLRASYTGYYSLDQTATIVVNDTVSLDFLLGPIPPPDIAYDPSSFFETAPVGGIVRDTLNISNVSGGPLTFSIAALPDNRLLATPGHDEEIVTKQAPQPIGYTETQGAKPGDEREPIYPPSILSHGGPDTYGNEWIDSDDAGGPVYSWVDISGIGTPVTFTTDDQFVGPVSMGMNFRFYGNTYNSIYLSSNGILTFGAGTTSYSNQPIPTAADPNNFIALVWDDLSPQRHGSVYYYYDSANNRFIISYSNIEFYSGGGDLYFEAILYPNGRVLVEYGTVDGGTRGLNSCTIGIENSTGTDGLGVVYNAAYLHSNMAIQYRPPSNWLTLNIHGGTLTAGNDTSVVVTFDATNLDAGIYTGHLEITSNDPDENPVNIPLSFTVGGQSAPNIEETPASLADTLITGGSALPIKVKNTGTATLTVSFTDSATWITETPGPFTVIPGDSVMETINLNASGLSPNTYRSAVVVSSNDPDSPAIRVPVTLLVQSATQPHINPSVTSFRDTIQTGGTVKDTLFIANTGNALLYYGLHDNRTWLTIAPDTGNVPASLRDTIVVTLSASALTPGNYTGTITLNSNDATQPLISMPVSLLVIEIPPGCSYTVGDINNNGSFNGLDVTYGVSYFKGGNPPPYTCECPPGSGDSWFVAGDVNASCNFNGLDISYMVSFFKGGPGPAPCADCIPGLLLTPGAGHAQKNGDSQPSGNGQ